LKNFGLDTNQNNQLLVKPNLQTTLDNSIYVLGDCAAVAWEGGEQLFVPPRAQAANQQAKHLTRQFIKREYYGKSPSAWKYRDFGSLVSLGNYSPVANLMSNFMGKNMYLEGFFSRVMYWSLYKSHEVALYGYWKTAILTLSRLFSSQDINRVKLH
jgi:NADH dehydrogenase